MTSGRVHDGRETFQVKLSRVTKYEVAPHNSSRKTMERAMSRREMELSSSLASWESVGFSGLAGLASGSSLAVVR